jgi:hypothetical protein
MTTPISEIVKNLKFISLLTSGETKVLSCSHPRIQKIWVYGGGAQGAPEEQFSAIAVQTFDGVAIRVEGQAKQTATLFSDLDEMLQALPA